MKSTSLSSGSYEPGDVTFLLTFLNEGFLGQFADAEGEVVEAEKNLSDEYLAHFFTALAKYSARVAIDTAVLANLLKARAEQSKRGKIGLVSLARAGTPLGVILVRALKMLSVDATHFSIGLCPVTGIDTSALSFLLREFLDEEIVFFDGWTAKGSVAKSLDESVGRYNQRYSHSLPRKLYCLSDLAGASFGCAGHEDYLIPSALLNATGCGLISRTFTSSQVSPLCHLNGYHDLFQLSGFHYSFFCESLGGQDLSKFFVNEVSAHLPKAFELSQSNSVASSFAACPEGFSKAQVLLEHIWKSYGLRANLVKPGVTEASRAILRRKCSRLLLNNLSNPDVSHLLAIAEERKIPIEVDLCLGCQAVVLLDKD